MILSSPAVLGALVFGVTPVLIFFLLRRRKKEIDWGASYLIRMTLQNRRKTSLWKQYVVLACRSLLIMLAVLLLAGLLRENKAPVNQVPRLPDNPVHRVVLLDNSVSMSVGEGGHSRFTLARQVLGRLCASQRFGDHLTLLPLLRSSGPAEVISFSGPMTEDIAQSLERLSPTEGHIAISPIFTAAFSALARTPEATAEIYVLSDFPRELDNDLAHLGWVREAIEKRGARLIPVNVAEEQEAFQNVVIEDAQIGSDYVLAGIPTAIYVTAVNHSDTEVTANLEVLLDGNIRTRQAVDFKPNERKRFPLWITLDQPGTRAVTVRTDHSRLEQHGQWRLSLSVRDKLKVWIAAADDVSSPEQAIEETEFLLRALNRPSVGAKSIAAEKVALSVLTEPIPDDIDLVILAAPQYAIAATTRNLETFVRRGGGLILAMTSGMAYAGYNEQYAPLLPAPLLGMANATVVSDQFSLVRPESVGDASALFDEFTTEAGGDLGRTRIYNYMRVDEDKLVGKVIFRMTDDAPLVLQRLLGRGCIFMFTSTLGISCNSMPVRQGFIPFWVRMAHAATVGREPARNVRPGEKLVLPWPATGRVTLTKPDQQTVELKANAWKGAAFVQLQAPDKSGLYRLAGGQHMVDYFTVRGVAPEGDLRSFQAGTQRDLETALGTSVFSSWSQAVEHMGSADATSDLWPWLLMLMLGLYSFEAWFVRQL